MWTRTLIISLCTATAGVLAADDSASLPTHPISGPRLSDLAEADQLHTKAFFPEWLDDTLAIIDLNPEQYYPGELEAAEDILYPFRLDDKPPDVNTYRQEITDGPSTPQPNTIYSGRKRQSRKPVKSLQKKAVRRKQVVPIPPLPKLSLELIESLPDLEREGDGLLSLLLFRRTHPVKENSGLLGNILHEPICAAFRIRFPTGNCEIYLGQLDVLFSSCLKTRSCTSSDSPPGELEALIADMPVNNDALTVSQRVVGSIYYGMSHFRPNGTPFTLDKLTRRLTSPTLRLLIQVPQLAVLLTVPSRTDPSKPAFIIPYRPTSTGLMLTCDVLVHHLGRWEDNVYFDFFPVNLIVDGYRTISPSEWGEAQWREYNEEEVHELFSH
ncbi:hypothetical protein IWQ60_009732 [Tieghemiomyces parasiticus]|uniref:Uncharacterized protein n=1 Tax=Tieghemiomyces parasiticus TaxID=78921 RepID=A0A9W7ZSB5_9FUNG|nr:hypothetical protein IWQ60_009732 [Tieghemiomyces parasiticus]